MNGNSIDWNKVSQISAVVYTVITALILVVALFQNKIQAWLTRPDLRLLIFLGSPDCQKTRFKPGPREQNVSEQIAEIERQKQKERNEIMLEGRVAMPAGEAQRKLARLFETEKKWDEERARVENEALIDGYYFRLRVSNSLGRGQAKQVEVVASELFKLEEGGLKKVEKFLSQNLLWTHLNQAFYPSLSAGMEKNCDLGLIVHPRRRAAEDNLILGVASNEVVFNFAVQVPTFTLNHIITAGTYRLILKVAAENAKPKEFTLELKLSGAWSDNSSEMIGENKCIGIKMTA